MSAAQAKVIQMAEKTPHARTPNTVARSGRISLQALGLYTLLASYAGDKQACWPSVSTLASLGGVAISTLRRTLRELENHGLVETKKRPGDSSIYHLKQDFTPVKSDRGTPVKSDTPTKSDGGDPGQIRQGGSVKIDRGGRSNQTYEEVQRRSTNEEVERERDSARVRPLGNEDPHNPHIYPPDEDAVKGFAGKSGHDPGEAWTLSQHWASQNWHRGNGQPITNWQLALNARLESNRQRGKHAGSKGNPGSTSNRPQTSFERRMQYKPSDAARSREELIRKYTEGNTDPGADDSERDGLPES